MPTVKTSVGNPAHHLYCNQAHVQVEAVLCSSVGTEQRTPLTSPRECALEVTWYYRIPWELVMQESEHLTAHRLSLVVVGSVHSPPVGGIGGLVGVRL